jgi:small-conductance mechanosensitive channel
MLVLYVLALIKAIIRHQLKYTEEKLVIIIPFFALFTKRFEIYSREIQCKGRDLYL